MHILESCILLRHFIKKQNFIAICMQSWRIDKFENVTNKNCYYAICFGFTTIKIIAKLERFLLLHTVEIRNAWHLNSYKMRKKKLIDNKHKYLKRLLNVDNNIKKVLQHPTTKHSFNHNQLK